MAVEEGGSLQEGFVAEVADFFRNAEEDVVVVVKDAEGEDLDAAEGGDAVHEIAEDSHVGVIEEVELAVDSADTVVSCVFAFEDHAGPASGGIGNKGCIHNAACVNMRSCVGKRILYIPERLL